MKGLAKLFNQSKFLARPNQTSQEGFPGWLKCQKCHHMLHEQDFKDHLSCCPLCGSHHPMSAKERIELLADPETFKELFTELRPCDPLGFIDTEPYPNRLARMQKKLQRHEGFYAGTCRIFSQKTALGVMDFGFMGGSMGSVVGEKITRLIEYAWDQWLPVVIVCASGGARMQESCLSLMQMAKTAAALAKLDKRGLPYISVVTHPTTGGVTASFATLGDVIIAEPQALVGFAGRKVFEQTLRQTLPENAQTAEFLLERGMVDLICQRKHLKQKIAFFLELFCKKKPKSLDKVEDEKPQCSDTMDSLLQVAKREITQKNF